MKNLLPQQQDQLLEILKVRFEKNVDRHPGIEWNKVQAQLVKNPQKLCSINEMERTGGEPDVVAYGDDPGQIWFFDCSAESPPGRRSICFDREGQDSRKEHKPHNNAVDMASEMGVEILTEAQYRMLQNFGPFDTKTSSWLQTPAAIRKLGSAIFGDFRYGSVFIYHNGAQSYYAARGFRALLMV